MLSLPANKWMTTAGMLFGILAVAAPAAASDQFWSVRQGQSVIILNPNALKEAGLTIARQTGEPVRPNDLIALNVAPETPYVAVQEELASGRFTAMQVFHREGLVFSTSAGSFSMGSVLIDGSASASRVFDEGQVDEGPRLIIAGGDRALDMPTLTYGVDSAPLLISPTLAQQIGRPKLAGTSIGDLTMKLTFQSPDPGHEQPSDLLVCSNPTTGPDVIVGALDSSGLGGNTFANYNAVGTIDAFALATYSCNIGNVNLNWIASNNQHPVIGGAMYRYKVVSGAGRFEQIGVAWLKHGFTALTDSICCTCNGQGGSVLGQGCADPYTATRNGTQVTTTGGLGPRFQTNAHTGVFTFPYMYRGVAIPGGETSISRRIQVQTADLDPAQNSGAQYYAEAQYVTADDAAAANQNNNASYAPCSIAVGTASQGYNGSAAAGATVRSKSAIQAWKALDASITETLLNVPEDSGTATARVIVSAKATSLGGGIYHYEYAVNNMNSDRCIQAFSVPVDASVSVTNIGFHDVFYHSFDGCGSSAATPITFDGTNWPGTVSGGAVHWDMVALTGTGAQAPCNSNALRFGTTYNFRFDADVAPTTGNATLTQWKTVNNVPASTVIPSIPVCTAPVVDPIHNDSASCGVSYASGAPSISSGTTPVTWSLGAGAPAGMTINPSTGAVSWPTPLTTGSPYTITSTATNSCGNNSKSWTLTVSANPPAVAPISNDSASCGISYTSAAPSVSGGATPLTWSLISGPAGMTINSATGAVTWSSPDTIASPYSITVQADSANGCGADSKSWMLTVNGSTPSINSIADAYAICGALYSLTPTTTGGAAPLTWTLLAGPAGMTIDASTGQVTWPSPTPTGSPFTVTVQAASVNNCGTSSPRSWQLGVVIGDFDADGLVTVNDIPGFADNLLLDVPVCAGDLNGDGFVDGNDISAFDAALGV